jgi:hypothetical protein
VQRAMQHERCIAMNLDVSSTGHEELSCPQLLDMATQGECRCMHRGNSSTPPSRTADCVSKYSHCLLGDGKGRSRHISTGPFLSALLGLVGTKRGLHPVRGPSPPSLIFDARTD